MFTGIVQTVGTVTAVRRHAFGASLVVDRSDWQPADSRPPRAGDSICVSGVCLTVTEIVGSTLGFDVIAETLAATTLGDLKVGGHVNLEPAVTAQQPLGGHVMQGHVDGTATVTDVHRGEDEVRLTFRPPVELMQYVIPKGSIAIEGVSLTLAAVEAERFQIALIPTTLKLTTLGTLRVGDRVNVETDVLTRTVVHTLRRQQQGGDATGVSWQRLRDAGFVSG